MDRCKTCFFFKKISTKYGSCSLLTNKVEIDLNFRFAYEKGKVMLIVPRYGICDLFKNQKKISNEQKFMGNK